MSIGLTVDKRVVSTFFLFLYKRFGSLFRSKKKKKKRGDISTYFKILTFFLALPKQFNLSQFKLFFFLPDVSFQIEFTNDRKKPKL